MPRKIEINKDELLLSYIQIQQIQSYTNEIINNLPPKALNELLGGYYYDQEGLLNEIYHQVNSVTNLNTTLNSEKLGYLDDLEISMDKTLRKLSYNYFKTTCLPNFYQGWRNLEWGNLIQLFPWSLFLAARAHGKCESPDTEVVMYDGTLKKIKDIRRGDKIMGIDSTPRIVLSIHSGEDDMYEIIQNRTENYIVNSEHFLHFKRKLRIWDNKKYSYKSLKKDEIINMPVKDFHNKSDYWKSKSMGYRIEGWELDKKEQKIHPYFLGIWLAEGNNHNCNITNPDFEIINWVREYVNSLGLKLNKLNKFYYSINKNQKSGEKNILLDLLIEYNLINNKHIPNNYLYGNKNQRLQLLAGIIDGDGYYNKKDHSFEFGLESNYENFAKQIQFLCWSLGFRCSYNKIYKKLKYKNEEKYLVHSLRISGFLNKIPTKVLKKQAIKNNRVCDPQNSSLKTRYLGKGEYYGITVDKDHLYLGKDGTVKHNSYEWAFAWILWRLYSYDRPDYYQKDTIDNKNRKETLLITNESTLGVTHLSKVIEEINYNEILREKLNPHGKELGKTGFTTETGSLIKLRSLFSSGIRGNHCGGVVYDDLLDESSLYSKDQRAKAKEIFYGAITPVVEPGGFFAGSGTPYAVGDLYTDIKNDPKHMVFEYPAISPIMNYGKLGYRLLSPDRFTYKDLLELKKSVGSSVFSREFLVSPVTDNSSLFPYEILDKCILGMENISFANNIESFPFKLKRIVCGCDFAISGNIGADFSVFSVWGIDNNENYYLIYVWRKSGASHNEQINQIVAINQRFKPNKIICENNGFQKIIADLAKQRGLRNIEPFTTTTHNKKNSYNGLPSLAAIMERGQMRMPFKSGETREMVETFRQEFHEIAFNEDRGTLEGIGTHDDCPMSTFFAINDLRKNTVKFKAHFV